MKEWKEARDMRVKRGVWSVKPNGKVLNGRRIWSKWGVIEDDVYLGLLGDIKAKVWEASRHGRKLEV